MISTHNCIDIINSLQDYILNETNIKKSLEFKINNIPKENSTKIREINNSMKNKNNIFIPREKDSLFWCFYIMKNGYDNYEMIDHKNFIIEKKIKIEYIEKIRKEKQIVKTYKFTTLTNLENNLANDDKLDINTFLTLCVIENINILFIKNKTYYELLMNDTNKLHIIHFLSNVKYGHEIDSNDTGINLKNTLYKLDNINKPINAISSYKVQELIDICIKLGIEYLNKETNKSKNKKDLYELIIQYF